MELLTSGGFFPLLETLHERGNRVFVDLKFFDVPATVAAAVRGLARYPATFCTIHGNDAMVRAAVAEKGPLKLLAVTALTSLDQHDLEDLGFRCDARQLVLSRARAALAAGCDGVVSSGLEVPDLRAHIDHRLIVVCPGIRPVANTGDDQKRTVDAARPSSTAPTISSSAGRSGRPAIHARPRRSSKPLPACLTVERPGPERSPVAVRGAGFRRPAGRAANPPRRVQRACDRPRSLPAVRRPVPDARAWVPARAGSVADEPVFEAYRDCPPRSFRADLQFKAQVFVAADAELADVVDGFLVPDLAQFDPGALANQGMAPRLDLRTHGRRRLLAAAVAQHRDIDQAASGRAHDPVVPGHPGPQAVLGMAL